MLEQSLGQLALGKILLYLLVFGVFVGIAWLFHFFLRKVAKRLAKRTRTRLDDALISALEKPVMAIIVLTGLYVVVLSFPTEGILQRYISQALVTALSLLGIFVLLTLLNTVIRWYQRKTTAEKQVVGFSIRILSVSRIILVVIAVWLAILVILAIWGLQVAPVASWLGEHGWRIVLIIILSVLAVVSIGETITKVVLRTLARRTGETEDEASKRSDTLSRVLVGTTQVFIFLIAIFMILSELRIDITPILASVGVIGIAIGFGAQSLVKDLVAGLFIILENQYRVGDVARIADVAGLVEDINLRRTVLRDLDGIVHVVPNGEMGCYGAIASQAEESL